MRCYDICTYYDNIFLLIEIKMLKKSQTNIHKQIKLLFNLYCVYINILRIEIAGEIIYKLYEMLE